MAFLERNCVYPADCLEVLRGLPDRSVDLVIADPPYYRMKGDFDCIPDSFGISGMVSGMGGGMPQDFEAHGCVLLLGELPDDRQALCPRFG